MRPFCGVSYKVSKEDAQQMIAAGQQGAPPVASAQPGPAGADVPREQPYPPQQ